MSTVKISELTNLPAISGNTSNTLFLGVDVPTGTTGKFTATTLANQLYANNFLVVGDYYTVEYPNTIGMFVYPSDSYIQTIIENESDSGTSDFVAMANTSTDNTHYIDVGYAGSNYDNTSPNNSLGTSLYPLDGYMYVQGNTGHPGGNLVIGTTTSGTRLNVIVGGVNQSNIVAYFDSTGIHSSGITSAENYANGAFVQANASFLTANTPSHVANSAALYANSAFNKANNALANTTGTFAGDLTVTGNVIIKTTAAIHNPSMAGNNQYLIITGTTGDALGTPSNPGYTIHTAVDGGNRIVAESYGTGSSSIYSGFIGRRGRGTAASPSAIQTNDIILRVGGNGYGTTKFSQFADARIDFVASENHTDLSKGTQIQFWSTAPGSNTSTQIGTMNGNTVTFTGTVNPAKGFVYTPNNITTTSTAYNVDFNRDSMIRMSVNDNSTITLSNFVSGKIVEVWITNSAAQNKTITHGCLANNSTVRSTSFTIQSSACAFLKYFSIDGDQANTYVSITA